MQHVEQGTERKPSGARLRIGRESNHDSSRINPAYTRLILQVDLSPEKTVEVDLSLVERQIRASVTAPDPLWSSQAEAELPMLEDAFQRLGFRLKDTKIEVGKPRPFEGLTTSGGDPLLTVDIEA
jgi:hypothetical protein